MRKLELKIETCGDCPYCFDDNAYDRYLEADYQCLKLWEGGHHHPISRDKIDKDCPLPLYIEGQKELF